MLWSSVQRVNGHKCKMHSHTARGEGSRAEVSVACPCVRLRERKKGNTSILTSSGSEAVRMTVLDWFGASISLSCSIMRVSTYLTHETGINQYFLILPISLIKCFHNLNLMRYRVQDMDCSLHVKVHHFVWITIHLIVSQWFLCTICLSYSRGQMLPVHLI